MIFVPERCWEILVTLVVAPRGSSLCVLVGPLEVPRVTDVSGSPLSVGVLIVNLLNRQSFSFSLQKSPSPSLLKVKEA